MVAKNPVKPVHITQIRHPLYNPTGDEESENCGPTSLAMACCLLGLNLPSIPGYSTPKTVQDSIDCARFWMFTHASGQSVCPEKDGIEFTPSGPRRAAREHKTLVNLPDIERGAENLGLGTSRIESWPGLRASKLESSPVLLAGDPSRSEYYSKRVGVSYSGGHIVLLVDERENDYLVCDPLSCKGPCWVSVELLTEFAKAAPFGKTLGLHLFQKLVSI